LSSSRILVTGGAGFIGSNFVRFCLRNRPDCSITVLDKLTYAGRMENLADVSEGYGGRFRFVRGDICDPEAVASSMADCDEVVNFAAETHVDRSIEDSAGFIRTDIEGVRVLLEEFRKRKRRIFVQISTDEVYGSVEKGRSKESDPLEPRSPYAASKAGGELLARSYWTTHSVPVIVTRSSNNYGPYQYPEKLIPLFVTNALDGEDLPLYGDGMNVRDWLYVEDHCQALAMVLDRGEPGAVYNIGAGQEYTNRDVTTMILEATGADPALVRFVEDRPGHDRRYALDVSLMKDSTGWEPSTRFPDGLLDTVTWFRDNRQWWEEIKSGRFREYYTRMYRERLRKAGKAT
jgi:dTDP-glucose 4,6-dehydratase